jgi:penicillin-binding protein 1A
MKKKILLIFLFFILVSVGAVFALVASVNNSLPEVLSLADYHPLLVSSVYSKENKKIGEFFRERRELVPFEKMPKHLVQAFLAAEDDQFYEHSGINLQAILRATLVNIRAGRTVQGGSTITQQVAKTLMLSSERTLTRKIKDVLLAIKMEKSLSKDEILYLYLNQIFFGQSSYGVGVACETYFRKPVEKISLAESAILAGLPQAPSRYSPVLNPKRAKERQVYVLRRMAAVGYIDEQTAEAAIKQPIKVYVKEKYERIAPFYLETLRQMLVKNLGEDIVLDTGIKIYTGLDLDKQLVAQDSVELGLKALDKRQGYRGPLKNIPDAEIAVFLEEEKKKLQADVSPLRIIDGEGNMTVAMDEKSSQKDNKNEKAKLKIPEYYKASEDIEGVVVQVDDVWGLVEVHLPESKGLIEIDTMNWARKPNSKVRSDSDTIKKPSEALKKGDVIKVKVVEDQFISERLQKLIQVNPKAKDKDRLAGQKVPNTQGFYRLHLEQDPEVQGSLLSLDNETQEVLAMVGGLNFEKSEFNRTIQAARQTGSSFKSIVYLAALDKGYTPATPILDAPVVFEESVSAEDVEGQQQEGDSPQTKTWKPSNHSKSFEGDILFRNALVKSLNVPTVRIIEDIGVPWVAEYSKRLGIFSPLNKDFTLALGSSSVTLYEMTKVFSQIARLGKRNRPVLVHKVVDKSGKVILEHLTLDQRFETEQKSIEGEFEAKRKSFLELKKKFDSDSQNEDLKKLVEKEPHLYFEDPDQLIDPTTAYLITTLLRATIEDPNGTAVRARALGRDVAGKTGTTNGYFDGWFVGFTPQITTGIWVGFDQERSIGVGEVGGRAAIPIWVPYMQSAHQSLPEVTFQAPPGIVVANIDSVTGKLPSGSSKNIIRQAFREGTEPTAATNKKEEEVDFYKQDLSE